MSRIPFKRHFVILVTCILAIGVIVPIATFAKGTPPGEQKRPAYLVHAQAGTPVLITTDCSSAPLQPLTTLQTGDTLTLTATLSSGDPNEESEDETLVIQEQNSLFTRTVLNLDVAKGNATIRPLIAGVANDNINACINGIDSDETGTVTFNITSAPKLDLVPSIVCEHSATLTGPDKGMERECSLANQEVPDVVLDCTLDIGSTVLGDLLKSLRFGKTIHGKTIKELVEGIEKVPSIYDFATAKSMVEAKLAILGLVGVPTACITSITKLLLGDQLYQTVLLCTLGTDSFAQDCNQLFDEALRHIKK